MLNRTLKTVAIATAVILATASASMAATYAWVDQNAKVRATHSSNSPKVNQVWEGQKVKVINSNGSWVKLQLPGNDGWVKANVLDFNPGPISGPFTGYGYGYGGYGGGSFCVGGNHGSFCVGAGY